MSNSCYLLCRQRSFYGGLILKFAYEYGLEIDGVILQKWGIEQKYNRFQFYSKRIGLINVALSTMFDLFDSIILKKKGSTLLRVEDEISRLNLKSFLIPTLNGQSTFDLISRLKPEILLLGGVGIISEKIINLVNQIVINAHPGHLPNYRGNYVVRWALLAKDPIFVTVHQVDKRVDTGKILLMSPVKIKHTPSLKEIEEEVDIIRAEYLIKATQEYIRGKTQLIVQNNNLKNNKVYSMPGPLNLLKIYPQIWKSKESINAS